MSLGKLEAAVEPLKEAVRLAPRDEEANKRLAEVTSAINTRKVQAEAIRTAGSRVPASRRRRKPLR